MELDDDIVNEFVEESREHLSGIELQLVQIEAGGDAIDEELVNTVFRSIHSIKGAAGFLGLKQINNLSHSFENVLGRVRERALIPDPFNVNVMLQAADQLAVLIDCIQTSDEDDHSELCRALDKLIEQENAAEGSGEMTATTKAPAKKKTTRRRTTKSSPAKKTTSTRGKKSTATAAAGQATAGDAAKTEGDTAAVKSEAVPAKPKGGPGLGKQADQTIRVNVKVLDRLMNLAGELVLNRNQLIRSISQHSGTNAFTEIGNDLDRVTTDIQEVVMQTRMQAVGQVFNKFPRIIRDLSSTLGKEINLTIEGAEVEIDKTIVEAIGDPLTHLIRNCCDHAIEVPSVRVENGKPKAGSVQLRAFHQAGKVVIEIEDDGAGMDPEKLKKRAVEKGVLGVEEAKSLSNRDAIHLIFAPGFSTAETISDVSGRGVGMDVVRTNIEKIGGNVEVSSTIKVGSLVRITLPLTLAIVPAMIVEVDGNSYALPQSSIIELIRTDGEKKAIENVNDTEILRLRGVLYPMLRAEDFLAVKKTSAGSSTTAERNKDPQIVLVESGSQRFALAVDRVLDSEDIVVKPLGRHLRNLPLLAGSTILGDGKVALILDCSGIQSLVDFSSDAAAGNDQKSSLVDVNSDPQRLVILSVTDNDRFGISMDIVKRIERIELDRIESAGNRKVLQYRGGMLPLIGMEEGVEIAKSDQLDSHYDHNCSYVIVFDVYGREVGLIAPRLHDIVEFDFTNGVQVGSEPGIAGIVPINGYSTRLVDLYGITEKIRPDWFDAKKDSIKCQALRILVCEDSGFFRNFLSKVLVEQGHIVTETVDGQEGLEQLDQTPTAFDLLITDVEMPRMSGFELTKNLRADSRFKDLPIIALTSLADEHSLSTGRAAGVDDYQIKMNKPALLSSIAKLASTKVSR